MKISELKEKLGLFEDPYHGASPEREAEELRLHKRAFDIFEKKLCFERGNISCIILLNIAAFFDCIGQGNCAVDCTAYAFKRTGADKSCRFAYKEYSVFTCAEACG